MGSKVVINVYLGIFLAAAVLLLFISLEVTTAAAARELTHHETSNNIRNVKMAKKIKCRPMLQCCDLSCTSCCGHVAKANADKT
ncbi:hypothetical protein OROHE_022077 [Orobanche hederae]